MRFNLRKNYVTAIVIVLGLCSIISLLLHHEHIINLEIPCQPFEIGNVTRIIHQSWKTKTLPQTFQRYFPSWRKCFPNWEHKFWTDEDNRKFITDHYPWFLKTYNSFPEEIYRADVARYFYMYHYGGVYTDMDNECLAPFEHLLENHTLVFAITDNITKKTPLEENYVQNSFMYSRPRQTFWLELIKNIQHRYYFYDTPDRVTGPEHLCKVIYLYRIMCPHNHGVKIYDAWYFNPFSWSGQIHYPHCKLYDEMSIPDWLECRKQFVKKGSFVVQYHTHVWSAN